MKFNCPHCTQRVSARDEDQGMEMQCPNCSHIFEVPITKERAIQIVEYAENEFASGRDIKYSFTPFEEGGASSPIVAIQALFIVIADFFWFSCVRKEKAPDAMAMFDDYARATGGIAVRIYGESTKIDSIAHSLNPKILERLSDTESTESFVSYLRTLHPENSEYWPCVYERIGIPFLLDIEKIHESNEHKESMKNINLFIKEHTRTLLYCGAIIIGLTIYSLFPRYYVHTAYRHTTIIDRWTGKSVSP